MKAIYLNNDGSVFMEEPQYYTMKSGKQEPEYIVNMTSIPKKIFASVYCHNWVEVEPDKAATREYRLVKTTTAFFVYAECGTVGK